MTELAYISQALNDCRLKTYLDKASGAQLDRIGRLVGAPRVLKGIPNTGFYGYYDSPAALGMGSDTDETLVAGYLKSDHSEALLDYPLNDTQYRNWIKARVIANTGRSAPEDIREFYLLILDQKDFQVEITRPEPAAVKVRLHVECSPIELSVVAGVSKYIVPAGVKFQVFDNVGEIVLTENV